MSAAVEFRLVEGTATQNAIVEFLYHEDSLRDAKARIGRTLRERRRALHLSLEAVAHLLGGSSGTASDLAKIERGVAPRGLELARRVDALLLRLEVDATRHAQRRADFQHREEQRAALRECLGEPS